MVTLMIADDEQLERQALRYIIEKKCPNIRIVAETGDGTSAIRLAGSERPDIILMDIRMPEVNGLEAALKIRRQMPEVMIVMLTAFDEFSYAKQALSAGAVEYLLKPLRPADLLQTLEEVSTKVWQRKQRQQQEEKLRKNLEEAMPFIQMSFVYDLISGNISDMNHFEERAGFLGMKTEPGVVLVADIDNFKQITRDGGESRKQFVKQQVFRHICSQLGSMALVTPFGGDNIIILLGCGEEYNQTETTEQIKKIAGRLYISALQSLGIGITIGIGRYYREPLEVHKSYLDAVSVLRQRCYVSDTHVMHIEDIGHLSPLPIHYPFHYERDLLDKVRCGERKQAKEALRQLLDEIFISQAGMETVKAYVLELLIVLSRAAVEGGANLEQLTLLNFNAINLLEECERQDEIHQWVLEALDRFMDNMLHNRDTMNARVINKASDYIVKNCHKNLSLEEVAHTVHLSPFYFSRLFKAEKGTNFVEFLTKARIERAKRMLKNPDQTIARIALECGYQDASYFCRVFRQEVSVTPNQYRAASRKSKVE